MQQQTPTNSTRRRAIDLAVNGSEIRIPAVDEHISDRLRTDFLAPRMFVPQHMVAHCRPTFVPIDTEDPALEGYPNIEMQGEYARYVIPPIDEPLGDRISRVTYDDDAATDATNAEQEQSQQTDITSYIPLDIANIGDPLQPTMPFQLQTIIPATILDKTNANANANSSSESQTTGPSRKRGLLGDYIRSFSLRHKNKNKNISDEQALSITYPLYNIDKRYGGKRYDGDTTLVPHRKTRRTTHTSTCRRTHMHNRAHCTTRKRADARLKHILRRTRRTRANV